VITVLAAHSSGTNLDPIYDQVLFWILAVASVGAGITMICVRQAVHCALMLAVVMLSLAVMYAMQGAPFLAFVQIIVYTGAVLMLFLFVVMLIGITSGDSLVETIKGQRLWAGIAGIATLIFTTYVFPFEATSALLITAALGAMVLAHRERTTPKPTQRDLARRKVASRQVAPEPPPGVYALHNAVDMPARLPDGSTTSRSVSKAVAQRDIDLGRDPEGNVAADLAVEDRIEAQRQIEAAARGRDEQ